MTDALHVRFRCDDPPTDLVVLLGEERPDVSSGYGGWDEVERPRRSTVTSWKGQPARRMSLSVLFDNWYEGTEVETDIRRLERMALPRPGGQPPTIHVEAVGGIIPPFYEALPWVLDAISWGDGLTNQYGNRVRQAATVTLLEYVDDDLLEKSPAKRHRARAARKSGKGRKKGAKQKRAASKTGRKHTGGHASPRVVTPIVYDGEDLLSVAARELGDARRWVEIAELNGIRDPRAVTRGQVIRLP